MLNDMKGGWRTFRSIFKGMGITLRHLFSPSVTLQYPEERMELPNGARARLYVNIDDCIGCNLCARACPVNCIDIETVPATADVDLGTTSTGNPKRFWLTRFNIDMAKCMYCDLCVHPCPTECIYMVPEYEYSEFDRDNLVYHFSNLEPDIVAAVKLKAEKEAEEKQRQREEMARQKAEMAKKREEEQSNTAGPAKVEQHANTAEPAKKKQSNTTGPAKEEQSNTTGPAKEEKQAITAEPAKEEQQAITAEPAKEEQQAFIAEPAKEEQHANTAEPAKEEQLANTAEPKSDGTVSGDPDKDIKEPDVKPVNSDVETGESSKKETEE